MAKRTHFNAISRLNLFRALLVVMFLTVGIAQSFSQTQKKISLKVSNTPLPTVLNKIEDLSGCKISFTYDEAQQYRVTVNVRNQPVNDVMTEVLRNTQMEFTIKGKFITVYKSNRPFRSNSSVDQQNATRTVKGVVRDSDGEPLVGATVKVIGKKLYALADMNGNFSIDGVSGNDRLEISYVGMETMTVHVRNSQAIVMKPNNSLEDVVVTGMFRKSTSTFTGAAVTVTREELQNFGNRNALQSLANIDPAFNILQNNEYGSDPNRLPDVQIRGAASIPNVNELQDESRQGLNTPLVILDGFESSLQALIDLNENEIESITILKDASATAIYGARGANGVIVVERRKPEVGRLRVSYSSYLNIEAPDLTSYNQLNAREKLEIERLAGKYEDDSSVANTVALQQQYNYLLAKINQGVDVDWMSKPVRTGYGQRHNLRLEGGNHSFTYSAAVQYHTTVGVMKGSERENFNGNINLSYMTQNVRFFNTTSLGFINSNETPYGRFSQYAEMNPYFEPYDEYGELKKTLATEGAGANARWGNGIANPLWNPTTKSYDKSASTSISDNFAIDWSVTRDFRVRGSISLLKTISESKGFESPEHTTFAYETDILKKGSARRTNSTSNSISGQLNLQYSHVFADKHSLYMGANFNVRQSDSESNSVSALGFVNENFDFMSMALGYDTDGKPYGSESTTRSMGSTYNINYAYDNRYFTDFTYTIDGNSAFGAKTHFGSFWSAGLGWNIHNEPFMKNIKWLNKLKIRASFGTNGSQNFSSYQALSTYRYDSNSRYYKWIGANIANLGNENLKWQRKFNQNYGIETEFLDRRLMLNLDYYIETTSDQISSINIPNSTGFSSYIENIGKVRNTGIEARITGTVLRNKQKGISWMLSASVGRNNNKIISLSQAMIDAQAAYEADDSSNPYIIYKPGNSMNAIWVVPSYGIDPATGKELFKGEDGHPTYTWSAKLLANCGEGQPKYRGSLNSTFRWKKFLFTFSMGYRLGGQLYNSTLIGKVENVNVNYNVDRRVFTDRWQQPGDKALFKGIKETDSTKKTSRFIQNESTFQGNSINLSYDWDSKWLRKNLHIERLTLHGGLDDIFYLSTVKRERGTSYPYSRQITMSISAMF